MPSMNIRNIDMSVVTFALILVFCAPLVGWAYVSHHQIEANAEGCIEMDGRIDTLERVSSADQEWKKAVTKTLDRIEKLIEKRGQP